MSRAFIETRGRKGFRQGAIRAASIVVPAILCTALTFVLPACGSGDRGPTADRPHTVIFILDAARADHFGCYGYARNTTPHVDRFAKRALRFENAFSEASFTFGALAALWLGAYPPRTGLDEPRHLGPDWRTLAESARERGYRTVAYSENPFFTSGFGLDQGFDAFFESFPLDAFVKNQKEFPEMASEAGIARALEGIGPDSEAPVFAVIHILRPHNPYAPPPPFRGRFGSGPVPEHYGDTELLLDVDEGRRELSRDEREAVITLYDENLAYGDHLFGLVIEHLESKGIMDRTRVIFLSDHGEAFGEHGRMLHSSTVFDEMTRIPLLVHWPGNAGSGIADDPVQLCDVHYTLLKGLGATAGRDELQGTSILQAAHEGATRRPLFSWALRQYGVSTIRSSRFKLILEHEEGGDAIPRGLYDLERDPRERIPLSPEDREEGKRLFAAYRIFLESCRAVKAFPGVEGDVRTPGKAIDEALKERLRALGYLR